VRWLGLMVAFLALCVSLYLISIHAVVANSDSASVALVGQSMAKGNVLLHGWGLSLDSFWTIDTPFYAAAYLFDGLRPSLLYAVPAFIAAIVILVGVLMAGQEARGSARIAGSFTVVALLAFPSPALATFFLQGPLHVGTALFALVAFWALRRGRFGWGFGVAVTALTAGMLGDLQMVAYGTGPILLGGICAMLRRRTWRAGVVALSAAATATVLAELVRRIADSVGTFSIGPANPIANFHQMATNVGLLFSYGSELLGIKSTLFGTGGVPRWLLAVHLLGAAVITMCVAAAMARLARGVVLGGPRAETTMDATESGDAGGSQPSSWRLDDMLVIACIASMSTFVVLTTATSQAFTRYLTGSVIFGAVLAGRQVARWWSGTAIARFRRGAVVAAFVVTLALIAGDGYMLSAPEPSQPDASLATWLSAHHLTHGVGDYWSASITTVQSRGVITVRPVQATAGNVIVRYPRESETSWYAEQRFQFLVFNASSIWISVDSSSAVATWGTPAQTYTVGSYRVLVWSHPISVGPDLLRPS
jgi:hypothetical protein